MGYKSKLAAHTNQNQNQNQNTNTYRTMKINNTNQNPKQIPTKDPSTTKRKQCSTIPIPKIRITTEYEMQISKFHKLRKKEKNNAPEDQESERT